MQKEKPPIKALILDMDGVLWRGSQWLVEPIPTFDRIRRAGLRFGLATNNATRSIDDYVAKFAQAGVELENAQVINSGLAAANYLASRYPGGGEVYLVGESGLVDVMAARGFHPGSEAPLAVVAGMDRSLTYDKIKTATLLIRSGVPFIGTNPDRTYPIPEGQAPGAGSILAAIEAATDVEPTIIGKPQPTMYEQLLPFLGTEPSHTLVIGDRLETDIAGGQAIGFQTACVLSGVSTQAMVAAWQPAPDFIASDLTALLDDILP